jgi:ubiquinone/menaquinone biosynthesis C-methylase UbiE
MSVPTKPAALELPPLAAPSRTALAIPKYLEQVYWWAYVHPNAVHIFERDWLVNTILFGNYGRLRDAALAELGQTITGKTLQVACAYGNITPRLIERMHATAQLDVIDILPIQLSNLQKKFTPNPQVALLQGDSAALPYADASYDHVLLFFLLHEQPESVRRATLAQALRVLKPGGQIVIIDYHRPAPWHPLRLLMRGVFYRLEPYAMDLWNHDVASFLPGAGAGLVIQKETYFGGLYQKLILRK